MNSELDEGHSERRPDDILLLEYLISNGRVEDARNVLRRLLLLAANLDVGRTIGDALSELVKEPLKNHRIVVILLRCAAVQGLLPDANSTNQIIRSTVELCEGALPDIVRFLKINSKDQNVDKFSSLAICHNRVADILAALTVPYGDLSALLSARREIAGSLNHSIVRQYAGPFMLKEIRSTIESIFGKMRRVSEASPTLLTDIEECNQSIAMAKVEAISSSTFLSREHLLPFLLTCEKVVSTFLDTLRGRFATSISLASNPNSELQKRYPLHESGREIQITIPFRNSGPGLSTELEVQATTSSEEVVLSGGRINLGNVLPGDFSVVLDAMVILPAKKLTLLLSVEWGEIGNPARKAELFEVVVVAQEATIDWQSLEYRTPYSTDVAEGDQFIGRDDKVRSLAAKLLRNTMESFYITGQKRVGKTSLALAAVEFAKANARGSTIESHYLLWGSVAHADPNISLQRLGESIESFLQESLPKGTSVAKGDYNGSLASLVQIANFALQIDSGKKFVILLDEFDEIHQELFLQGNLAETFFANLRALSRCRNICIVLIGGENMPFVMDRQGQKLNNFSRVNLSYFSRTTEWSDFQLIVRRPTSQILNWHDDAISEVFNITNGNPYFANIVCAGVMRLAVSERDADVTSTEIYRVVEREISTFGANSFAHLWQDGVPKPLADREPDILRRMRVLVALARCLRHGHPSTLENIVRNKTSANLSEGEVLSTLNDFVRREVLSEADREFGFGLPIFRLWLMDVGVSQLFADALNEELANAILVEENEALVRSEEVAALSREWTTFRGKHIGTDEIRAWYQQVESLRDQRLLFELLKRTKVYSEAHIRERLRSAHAMLRPSLPEFIIRKRGARRNDVLVTYVDGEGKSGAAHASTYAEENSISAECVLSGADFGNQLRKHRAEHGSPAAIVIIDDIAATGQSLSANVSSFVEQHAQFLADIKIRIITLVATKEAQAAILSKISEIGGDIDFRSCEILSSSHFAFPLDIQVWKTDEQQARAKALCVDLGSRIYQHQPLGYGNLGLLVVFPTTVPNNSLPILHSHSRTSSLHRWEPLFPRLTN
jgi:hypothetical protein